MAGTKKKRSYFISSVLGPLGKLLRTGNRPNQQAFEDLAASAPFFDESSDRARLDSVVALKDKQGLVVLATDTQAKANQAQQADRSLVAQPSQLPSVSGEAQVIADYNGNAADTAVQVVVDGAVTTRNNFITRFKANFITFLNTLLDGGTQLAGTGVDLFKQKTGRKLEFRKIKGAGDAVVDIDADEVRVTVNIPPDTDELVKISADDTTAGYLEDKVVAGPNIVITKLNPAANEQLQVEATVGGGYKTASVSNISPAYGQPRDFTVSAGLDWTEGMGVTILDLDVPGNIIYGKVISYVGTTLSVFISQVLGTGVASTNWLINVGAPVGLYTDTLIHAQSTSGPYDIATSLGTAKTFNVLAEAKTFQGVAFAVGMRIRATRNGTSNWMEGICTSFTVTSMVIQIDRISGTGNFAGWELTIADGYALEEWREVGNDGGNTTLLNSWSAPLGIFYRKDYNTGVVYIKARSLNGAGATNPIVFTFSEAAYTTANSQSYMCEALSNGTGGRFLMTLGTGLRIEQIDDFDPWTLDPNGFPGGLLNINTSYNAD